MSQHHKSLSEAVGIVYHWDLVKDEIKIPVVSHYRRMQTDNGVSRTVPISLPRLSFLNDKDDMVVNSDPIAVEPPPPLPKRDGPILCPKGKPASRFSGQPLEPREAKIFNLILEGHTQVKIGEILGINESSVRRALFKARAKLGEFDDPASPKN